MIEVEELSMYIISFLSGRIQSSNCVTRHVHTDHEVQMRA